MTQQQLVVLQRGAGLPATGALDALTWEYLLADGPSVVRTE